MLEECFLFPSLISTEHSIPLLEISHRLSWEPAPWASGAWPPHHPHLGGLLAAQLGSFDICGFLRSISSTVSCSWFLGLTLWFLGLTLWRRGWRWSLGGQGPVWVTALWSGPTQQGGSCTQFPSSWKSRAWGIGRDARALDWVRAGEVLPAGATGASPALRAGSTCGWPKTPLPGDTRLHALVLLAAFFPVLIQLLPSSSHLLTDLY